MTHEIIVDKQKYEIPPSSKSKGPLYPFDQMTHGDSFDVQCSPATFSKISNKIYQSFSRYRRVNNISGIKHRTRLASNKDLGHVCRFWIVKKDTK